MILRALCLILLPLLLVAGTARAQDPSLAEIAAKFATAEKFDQTEALVRELGATGDPAVRPLLEALGEGRLQARKSDGAVYIVEGSGKNAKLLDPLTGEEVPDASASGLKKVKVNNGLRRVIRDTLSSLTLGAKNPQARLSAASNMLANPDPAMVEALDAAIAAEGDPAVKQRMQEARAAAVLQSDLPDAEKIAAVEVLGSVGDRNVLSLLAAVEAKSEGDLRRAAERASNNIRSVLAAWDAAQNIWFGISLGSVLLLAAIGLAITFGVMGVINMAHGEMVMIGAYVAVLSGIWLGANLLVAIPIAFVVTALFGLLIERLIVRRLYGRLLDTLLATWGISILIQQAVRLEFGLTFFGIHFEGLGAGLQNVTVPAYLQGTVSFLGLEVNSYRAFIIAVTLILTALTWAILYRTSAGVQVRAIIRNPKIAAACGIDVKRVNALTFAFGSGLAGVAGVMMSGFKTVFPDMGGTMVVDGFMVVVTGGIGSIFGTIFSSGLLGEINALVAIGTNDIIARAVVFAVVIGVILFKPNGLFSFKGR